MPDHEITKFDRVMLDRIKKMFGVERVLWVDLESFSEIDLKEVGNVVYAEHPSTEIILGAYSFDNDPVQPWDRYAWDIGDIEVPTEPPQEFYDALLDPSVLKVAWNMAMEYSMYRYTEGIQMPFDQLMDPMVAAFYLSFPGGLGKASKLVGLSEDKAKDADGKRLIRKFSKPAKPLKRQPDRTRIWPMDDPADWRKYRRYNIQDVAAMRAATYRLFQYPMPIHEWRSWQRDFEMNARGIPVNPAMIEQACGIYDRFHAEQMEKLRDITGLENPNSGKQLLPWLQESGEYVFDNLRKASVARTLNEDHLRPEDPEVLEVLRLRKAISQTSAKKFHKFRSTTCSDNTIKFAFQFGGAQRTLRWSGRMIQPQNLKSPSEEIGRLMPFVAKLIEEYGSAAVLEVMFGRPPMDVLSESVRGAIQSPEGYVFADSDLSAIENVVLGWVSYEDKILDVFRQGRDPYISFAQFMYQQPYEELWHEYKVLGSGKKRKVAKPAVLGAGYRLGPGHRYIDDQSGEEEATGLLGYGKAMGIELTDEEAEHSVRIWRETYSKVKDMWYKLENAAMETINTRHPVTCGRVVFDYKHPFMRIKLPSGRHLHYYNAHIRPVKAPWGDMVENVCYYGLKESRWCLISTHGGKLMENIVQAIARDILDNGLRLAYEKGLDVRMHIHDQIVALVRDIGAEAALAVLRECMAALPEWATDMPLNTGAILVTHFTKD